MSEQQSGGLPNPIPPRLAFVIQFVASAAPADEHMSGRIEHIISGRQRPFSNANELLSGLREMLTISRREGGRDD